MAWTQADLDAIETAIAQGVEMVRYRDRVVNYRSLDEMLRTKQEIEQSLATTPMIRQFRVNSSKGFRGC